MREGGTVQYLYHRERERERVESVDGCGPELERVGGRWWFGRGRWNYVTNINMIRLYTEFLL